MGNSQRKLGFQLNQVEGQPSNHIKVRSHSYRPSFDGLSNKKRYKSRYREKEKEGNSNFTQTKTKNKNKNKSKNKNIKKRKSLHQKKKVKKKEVNVFMVGLDGAGKSTILYKNIARNTYSSASMHIPQTITYNVETIKSFNNLMNDTLSVSTAAYTSRIINDTKLYLNIYDFGGKKLTRNLWINYKSIPKLSRAQIDFIIIVIDCSDINRLDDRHHDCVQNSLKPLLNSKHNLNIPVCIFAHKQDLKVSGAAIDDTAVPYRLFIKQITIYHLITIIKDIYNDVIDLKWKISKEILSYLPEINYYWDMSQRQWSVFPTSSKTKNGQKGINMGLQWLYDEYERIEMTKTRKRSSFVERLSRLTM